MSRGVDDVSEHTAKPTNAAKVEPVWKVKHTVGRFCDSCGVVVRPGDGGIRVQGTLYCSEECADEADA